MFSVWDRLARSLRMRSDPRTLRFGLPEFPDPGWQTVWGMWKTPFMNPASDNAEPVAQESGESALQLRQSGAGQFDLVPRKE